MSRFALCLIILALATPSFAENHNVTVVTVEPTADERDWRVPDVDFNWLKREIDKTWVFVRSLLGGEGMKPPIVSFDYLPRQVSPNPHRPSLEVYNPAERPHTVHISWDIFRINDNPRRTKISGYVEWAIGHGLMHHILTGQDVPPETQHCVMLERGHALKLLEWLDSAYHTPGSIIVSTGMYEIRFRCVQEKVSQEKREKN